MLAVVIDRVSGDQAAAARSLAAVLGKIPAEVRPSVSAPSGGPAIVAVLGHEDAASQLAWQLRGASFTCDVVPVREPLPDLVVAKRFELHAATLDVEDAEGTRMMMLYNGVDVLLRGVAEVQVAGERTSGEFLVAFAGNAVCWLREHDLFFPSLGKSLQASRNANFRVVVERLQTSCTRARRDDRLMRRAAQAQLLGPMLSPDDHLELAAMLLARSLRAQ
ncbi:MAG TPA: hypothetical protein VG755_31340 [Nannocystaceae bacterium]|nr:hypothetical protein [Nannocystaceae bacterium]